MGYKKFIHQRYFDAFLLLTICFAQSFAASKIRHIRARYDAHNDEIVVEWEWRGQQRLDGMKSSHIYRPFDSIQFCRIACRLNFDQYRNFESDWDP